MDETGLSQIGETGFSLICSSRQPVVVLLGPLASERLDEAPADSQGGDGLAAHRAESYAWALYDLLSLLG
jgi:hypothetical protein